jgi:hypothetical protein
MSGSGLADGNNVKKSLIVQVQTECCGDPAYFEPFNNAVGNLDCIASKDCIVITDLERT